ncbi:hypothetical protein GGR52DRAFT_424230 [Hypoxylon sp. FL1284]|nr:hypothetical protein GGR52DRAFT_424230 [Hypoxylon sp. FL1284]
MLRRACGLCDGYIRGGSSLSSSSDPHLSQCHCQLGWPARRVQGPAPNPPPPRETTRDCEHGITEACHIFNCQSCKLSCRLLSVMFIYLCTYMSAYTYMRAVQSEAFSSQKRMLISYDRQLGSRNLCSLTQVNRQSGRPLGRVAKWLNMGFSRSGTALLV